MTDGGTLDPRAPIAPSFRTLVTLCTCLDLNHPFTLFRTSPSHLLPLSISVYLSACFLPVEEFSSPLDCEEGGGRKRRGSNAFSTGDLRIFSESEGHAPPIEREDSMSERFRSTFACSLLVLLDRLSPADRATQALDYW